MRVKTFDPFEWIKKMVNGKLRSIIKSGRVPRYTVTIDYLQGSWEEIKAHIESQFQPGMTWENHGTAWQIDHLVPQAAARSHDDIKSILHYRNLRPTTPSENATKYTKLPSNEDQINILGYQAAEPGAPRPPSA